DDENRQAARNVVENTNGWNAKHRREDHISERKSDANSIGDCIGQKIHGRRKRHESGKEDQRKEVQEARGHCFRSNCLELDPRFRLAGRAVVKGSAALYLRVLPISVNTMLTFAPTVW